MTSGMDDRQKAFETKFKMDEETQFRLNARAVHLFGKWAAGQLGLSGADADAYAEQVVDSDFDQPGIADFISKVQKDFVTKGITTDAHHLENQFKQSLDDARKQILAEAK